MRVYRDERGVGVQSPRGQAEMQSHVTEFKAALKKLVTIGSIPEVTRHAWDYRLNQIDNFFKNNNALANSGRVKPQ